MVKQQNQYLFNFTIKSIFKYIMRYKTRFSFIFCNIIHRDDEKYKKYIIYSTKKETSLEFSQDITI